LRSSKIAEGWPAAVRDRWEDRRVARRDDLQEAAARQADAMVARLAELVLRESSTGEPDALEFCADLLVRWGDAVLGRPAERLRHDGVPHLLWRAPDPAVLVVGHYDTVWPLGTIAQWPMTVLDGVARGPGVFDMKAGIVQLLAAVSLVADRSRVSVLLNCDEEIGSPGSRAFIEAEARRVRAVLVCEPAADGGHLKIARKGVATYAVTITGRAAHAGLEPERGVNAGIEVAHQVLGLGALAKADGTSVTPTVLSAGTTQNTVPEEAVLHVDVRAWTRAELIRVDRAMHALRPHLPGAAVAVSGGITRFPLEPDVARPVLRVAQDAARDIGMTPPDGVGVGGASDGNLTGALGVPTLDGLGALGAHPHAREERVDLSAMPERAALLAALIDRLCGLQSIRLKSIRRS
jgi:glutamate carboxypeptidase